MHELDQAKFDKAKEDAETYYKTINEVHCPFFNEKIVFNSKGLEHIKFKNIRQARPHWDQYVRLKLISLAPKIINASHTIQGISTHNSFEREKTHGRWDTIMRSATYYEFVAVIKDTRVRIVIKQVGGGIKYFWSIIPFWKMDKISGRRLIHNGKPESD